MNDYRTSDRLASAIENAAMLVCTGMIFIATGVSSGAAQLIIGCFGVITIGFFINAAAASEKKELLSAGFYSTDNSISDENKENEPVDREPGNMTNHGGDKE